MFSLEDVYEEGVLLLVDSYQIIALIIIYKSIGHYLEALVFDVRIPQSDIYFVHFLLRPVPRKSRLVSLYSFKLRLYVFIIRSVNVIEILIIIEDLIAADHSN